MKEYSFGFRRILIPCAIFALALVITASCSTERLTRRVDKAAVALFKKDSVAGVQEVGKFVPIKEAKVLVSTRYVQGKTDTVNVAAAYTVNCDSAIMATLDEASRKRVKCPDCPPSTVRVDTFIRDSLHTIIDPLTQAQLNKAQKQLLPAVENGVKWKSRALWGWGLFILLVLLFIAEQVLKFRKI